MITHSWNGTVLTITSDSGTSSMDLKGDRGIRGAQGQAGIILDTTGEILLTGYATKEEVTEAIEASKPVETTKLDFSGWDAGYFVETLADGTENTYVVEYDTEGNVIKVAGIEVVGV